MHQPALGPQPDEQQLKSCIPDSDNASVQLLLTTHHLHLLTGPEALVYQLQALVAAEVKQIRVMGLYIGGGLLALLSVLAMTSDVVAPLYGILGAMLGAFLFYRGWYGKNRFTLHLLNDSHTFWLPGDILQITQFTNSLNYYLRQYHAPPDRVSWT